MLQAASSTAPGLRHKEFLGRRACLSLQRGPQVLPRLSRNARACEASASGRNDPDASDSPIPDRLPLAGADTDWREFRARLVASESARASPASHPSSSTAGSSLSSSSLLDDSGEWAHPLPAPEKGGLLLAHPLMFHSSQKYFHKSVIFLFEHGPEGSAGLILNLPTVHTIGSLGAAAGQMVPEFKDNVLHLGGDVGDNTIHMLHNCAILEDSLEVMPGMYMGGYEAATQAVRNGQVEPSSFKWFTKYSGWGPGQLQREVDAGVWFTAAAGAGLVLNQQQQDSKGPSMWHQVLELMGGEFKNLSEATREEFRPDIMGLD